MDEMSYVFINCGDASFSILDFNCCRDIDDVLGLDFSDDESVSTISTCVAEIEDRCTRFVTSFLCVCVCVCVCF